MPLKDGAASRVSVHSALWATQWGKDLAPHIEKASSLGFDGVDVSLLGDRFIESSFSRRHSARRRRRSEVHDRTIGESRCIECRRFNPERWR